MSQSSILNFYQNIHAGFLHANGEKGTDFLIDQLQLKGEERVLEIGFGTGASLVKFKSRFPEIELAGLELSREMMERARKRLVFCGLGEAVELLHLSEAEQLGEAAFDLVYIESVLAILDATTLASSIQLVRRLLKPGGLLALNESIWLEDISLEDIQRINRYCEKYFGIQQCNEVLRNREAAINWFRDQGFTCQFDQRIFHQDQYATAPRRWREWRSQLYTKIGKLRLYFQSPLKQEDQQIKHLLQGAALQGKDYISGMIMVLKRN